MENTEQHQAIGEYLRDYHSNGRSISPRLVRKLTDLGLINFIENLPGKSAEEDIRIANEKYSAYQQKVAHNKTQLSARMITQAPPPPPPAIQTAKLTKQSISSFLQWSTTRYNDYLGCGTKKSNVDKVFKALKNGNFEGKTEFTVRCASPVGENISKKANRYWKTSGRGGEDYTVNCSERTIHAKYRNQILKFD